MKRKEILEKSDWFWLAFMWVGVVIMNTIHFASLDGILWKIIQMTSLVAWVLSTIMWVRAYFFLKR